MISSQHQDDYIDFLGAKAEKMGSGHLDTNKAALFIKGIGRNACFSELVEIFGDDWDQLAVCAVHAFYLGRLTRYQATTFLEYRSMKMHFEDVRIIDARDCLYLDMLVRLMDVEQEEEWLTQIKKMPHLDACMFILRVPKAHLSHDKIKGLLDLSEQLKIIKQKPLPFLSSQKTPEFMERNTESGFMIGSVDIRNAILQMTYGEHAKKSFPRLGTFHTNTIEKSIHKYGRYRAVDYPGIPCISSFHGVEASPIYVILHDEVHLRFMSTIPAPVYAVYLDAIQLVRDKTGITWSREIWEAMDMEIAALSHLAYNSDAVREYVVNDIQKTTDLFATILNAQIFSEGRRNHLFSISPYVDTTWLLMIDLVMNAEAWKNKNIDFTTLRSDNAYRLLYDFVVKHKTKIENITNPALQVAIIKAVWFEIDLQLGDKIAFEKNADEPRYIQVNIDGKPVVQSKEKFIRAEREVGVIKQDRTLDPNTFFEFIIHDPILFRRQQTEIWSFLIDPENQDGLVQYKNKILHAIKEFTTVSLKMLDSLPSSYKGEVLLHLLTQGKLGRHYYADTCFAFSLFEQFPEHADSMRQSIFLFYPDLQELFSFVDRYINKKHIDMSFPMANRFEELHQKKMLNDLVVSLWANTGFDIDFVDSIIKLKEAKLDADEYLNFLAANYKNSIPLTDALIKLNHEQKLTTVFPLLQLTPVLAYYVVHMYPIFERASLADLSSILSFISEYKLSDVSDLVGGLLMHPDHLPTVNSCLKNLKNAGLLFSHDAKVLIINPVNALAITILALSTRKLPALSRSHGLFSGNSSKDPEENHPRQGFDI